jgi:hypothetical protein
VRRASDRSSPSLGETLWVIGVVCLVDLVTAVTHVGWCEAGENQSQARLDYCMGTTPRIPLYAAVVAITLGAGARLTRRPGLLVLATVVGGAAAAMVWIIGQPRY